MIIEQEDFEDKNPVLGFIHENAIYVIMSDGTVHCNSLIRIELL